MSFKLKKARVRNSPDMWIRADGAFEPIVERHLFDAAQAIIQNRSRRVSDTEMLAADMMSARPRLILIDQYQQRLSRQLARLTRDLRQLQQDRAHCDVEAENDADAKADVGEGEAQTEIVKTNPIRPEAMDLQEVAPVPVPSPARGAAPLNEQSGPLGRPALPAPSLVRDLHLRRPAAETRERLSA